LQNSSTRQLLQLLLVNVFKKYLARFRFGQVLKIIRVASQTIHGTLSFMYWPTLQPMDQ